MYEVGVVGQFEAAHRLQGDFGPATRLHGHTYRLEMTIRGEAVNSDGVLFDVGGLQAALSSVTDRLNYRNLDEIPELGDGNTTAERVARYIHGAAIRELQSTEGFTLKVCVWESPTVFASYEATAAAPG